MIDQSSCEWCSTVRGKPVLCEGLENPAAIRRALRRHEDTETAVRNVLQRYQDEVVDAARDERAARFREDDVRLTQASAIKWSWVRAAQMLHQALQGSL